MGGFEQAATAFKETPVSDEEAAAVGGAGGSPEDAVAAAKGGGTTVRFDGEGEPIDDAGKPVELPDWAKNAIPQDPLFRMPEGKQITFMRFRAALTDSPKLGERVCILWRMSVADETAATKRAQNSQLRVAVEYGKQCVRAVDGKRVDWTGVAGTSKGQNLAHVAKFFDDIGAAYRQQVMNYYFKTHSLNSEEQGDFFQNCVVSTHQGG